jgi:hypothetical protein
VAENFPTESSTSGRTAAAAEATVVAAKATTGAGGHLGPRTRTVAPRAADGTIPKPEMIPSKQINKGIVLPSLLYL